MKKTGFLLMILMVAGPAFSQDYYEDTDINTLFGDHHVSHGGYGAFTIQYSQIGNDLSGNIKDAVIFGGRGMWVIGHWFALGLGGSGFINDYHYDPNVLGGRNVNLSGGYGGLVLEPILIPKLPVHISLPVLFGAGGAAYITRTDPINWEDPYYYAEDATPFFIVEPGVELEFNIVRFFRLAAGVTYRFTSDLQLLNTAPDALTGMSYGVTLKFGKF